MWYICYGTLSYCEYRIHIALSLLFLLNIFFCFRNNYKSIKKIYRIRLSYILILIHIYLLYIQNLYHVPFLIHFYLQNPQLYVFFLIENVFFPCIRFHNKAEVPYQALLQFSDNLLGIRRSLLNVSTDWKVFSF